MYPRFLGIGAQKAGSTWLHAMLSKHRELWLPHLKELHFFDRRFPIKQVRGTAANRPGRGVFARHVSTRLRRVSLAKLRERLSIRRWSDLAWEIRYLFGDWDTAWYASLFEAAKGRMAGEITPAYSCLGEEAITFVYELMPDARLIFLMRDPVERAWSHAKMDLARTAGRSIGDVGDAEYISHFEGIASRLRGDYLGTIRRWSARFPEDRFFVGFYDEILECPDSLLTRIHRFLNVSATPSDVPPSVRSRINPGAPSEIPAHLRRHLAALYVEELRLLAQRYGSDSYAQRWLARCEESLVA
jgi:hypothetical protein